MKKFDKKQRFSIRKYSFGAGSVLVGLCLSFTLHSTKVEAAETVTNVQTNIGHKVNTGDDADKENKAISITSQKNQQSENANVNTSDQNTASEDKNEQNESLIKDISDTTTTSNEAAEKNKNQETDNKQQLNQETTNTGNTASKIETTKENTTSKVDSKTTSDKSSTENEQSKEIQSSKNTQDQSSNAEQISKTPVQETKANTSDLKETTTSTQHVNSTSSKEKTPSIKANSLEESASNVPSKETTQTTTNPIENNQVNEQATTGSTVKSQQASIDAKDNNEQIKKVGDDSDNSNIPTSSNVTAPSKQVTTTRSLKTLVVSKAMVANAQDASNKTTQLVDKNNFNDYFKLLKGATYDPSTGIITLTENKSAQQGNVALNTKIDMSQSFTLKGKINLGSKNSTNQGGDGVGFVFQPNDIDATGIHGGALGIGGLKNAFGFKFDTWYNESGDTAYFDPDPKEFASNKSKVMGAFMSTDNSGKAQTDSKTMQFIPGTSNKFNDVTIEYDGATKNMKVTYIAGVNTYTFTKDLSAEIQKNTNYALTLAGSTGWAYNLQQFQLTQFSYTARGVVKVNYVDSNGKPIPNFANEEKLGNINEVLNTGNNINAIQNNGYQLVNATGSNANTFNSATNSVTVTTNSQTVTYTFKDIKEPTVDKINSQTKEVNTAIDSVVINASDNSGQPVSNSVSGLPDGVTFNSANNTISGTPNTVGNHTVNVTSTDNSGNSTTTQFNIIVKDTISPVIDKITDQSTSINTPIKNITITGTDNSKQPIKNTVSTLPMGLTFDQNTNTISGTPSKLGSYPIVITSVDPSGNTTTTKFTINVTDTIAPTITNITDQTKEVNTPIESVKVNATDNSGEVLSNTVSGLPDGVTFNPETNIISGTPTKVGEYNVTVTSKDSSGNSSSTTFKISVTDTIAPNVDTVSDQTKEVNTSIEPITIHATDNSGQPVKNTVSGLPEGVTFDPETNTISGTPSKVGNYPVTVTSTDEQGNETTTTFTITVEDTTKPTVDSVSDQTKEVNTAINPIEIHATDNSGQPVKNTVSGLPEGVTFNPETNTISGTPTQVGTSTVTVTSRDEQGNETTTTFTITVQDTTAPTVNHIDNQTKEVNTGIDPIEIHATDNSGQPVKNTVSVLPEGVTFDPETNTISGTPTKVGTSTVTVTSRDEQGNETTTTFTITVQDTTRPNVESISNQTREVNTAINPIEIHATDNSGQPVKNTVAGLPEGVTFDPETNTISGTPTQVGTSTVTVTSRDEQGNETTTTFTITVEDTIKPTVEDISNQTKEVNTGIDPIEIHATDNSGQPVKNTVSGLPEGVTFDPETNTISGMPSKVGSYPVTVTSTDEQGNETTTTFTITVKDTTKPTVDSVSNQTKEVNTAIDPIEIHATDNSGQPVKNTVSGLPEGVTFNPETNTISGTPSKVGNYPVTVTSTDEQGNKTTTSFTITVKDTTAPNVESISDQTKEVNTGIDSIEIHATDNSGQPVKNTVSGLPEGVTFDPETNTISGMPSKVGNYPVTVTTTDEQGNETTTTFTITVKDTIAPNVESISDQTKEVNTGIDSIEIHATDNSGQPVKNTVSGLPEGVTFDPETNTISGMPSKVGNYPVTVTTTDEEGNETTTTFTITVKDTMRPNIESISDQTKEVNTAIDPIEIDATDNSSQPVKNTVSGLPEGVTFNPETNTISGTPTQVGTSTVTVTSRDEQGNETTTTFTITVKDTTKPTVEDISNQTKEVNTGIDPIEIDATDNSGQPVKNTVSGLPEGVTFDPETNTISGTPSKVGTSTVTVTSRDEQGNETTTTFTITVKDTTKPAVEDISNQTKEVNTSIDPIEIHATDNSGQPVKNTVSGLPEGVTFNPETNTISGTPTKVGNYPVTVTTTDEQGNETTTTFTITVKDTTKPTVDSVSNQTKEVNTSIDPIEIHATDNSGQPVKNAVSGLPEGVTFNPETNTISGTPSKVGNYPVTVITKDEQGNETTTSFTIIVEDTTKPTVDSVSDQTKEVNTAIDPITIHATDNSGQPVKNTVSGLPEGVTFNPETNTISGTPNKVGTSTVTVTSRDEQGNETTTIFTITVQDTTVPTVNHIDNQTREVNTAIDPIEIHATDNSGQAVKNTVSGLPEGVTFDSETNTISGTPSKVGNYPVTVTTTDEEGNETTTTFTITVEDTTKPTVDSISNQTKEVNTSIDPIEIHATDNSSQAVKNTVSGLPEGVTFNPETNTISGTPSKVGSYPVTVTSTDEQGNETTTTFTITVKDTTKPTVEDISNQTKEVNTGIDPIEIHATDNSGQPVKNTVSGLPEGVTFDPETNTISGMPSKVGSYPVTVTSTDEQGNETTTTFTITVKDTTAPTVNHIDNQTKEVNTSIDPIEIHATDNSGQPVKNSVSGLPEGVTFNPETNTISGTPSKVGNYPVTVTTTDEQGNETTTTFTITVKDTTAPTVNHIDNQTKEINTAIDPITIHATDNSGQPVKNTVSGLPKGVTFDPKTNTISGVPTQVGVYPVTVTTMDSQGNKTTTTFTITVKDTTAPKVDAIPDQTKHVNTPIDPITIHAIDNSGQPVKNTVAGLPEGVTFNPETNTISGTPTKVGSYPVTVTTTDEQGNKTTTTFTITVKDTTAPKVDAIPDQTKHVNTPIDPITIHATDNSGQPVKNTVSGLPEGVTFDPKTNIISGVPTQVGVYPVTVTTVDSQGNETTTTFNITVIDSNQNGIPSDNHPTASHDKDNQGQAPVSSNEENGNIGENKSPITSSPDIDHQQSNNIEETNTQGQYNYSSFEDEKNNKNINYLSQTSKGTKKKENINFNSNSSNKSETPSHVTQENQQDMTKALNRNQVLTDDKKDKVDVLPDTGETDPKNSTLFAGIFAALGSLFILGRRRKKKDEQ